MVVSRRSGCCRSRGLRVMRVRRGTSSRGRGGEDRVASSAAGVSSVVADAGRARGDRLGDRGRLACVLAVAAWSRWRFVRVARDEKAATTMRLLAECFEESAAHREWCWLIGWVVSREAWSRMLSCRPRTMCVSRRISGSGPISARQPIPSPKVWSRRCAVTCKRT